MRRVASKKTVKTKVKVKKVNRIFSRAELQAFRGQLLQRRGALAGDVVKLEGEALKKSRQEAAGELSAVPLHMADQGSDEIEQEVTLEVMESEQDELTAIKEALERVDEGTFGLCELCQKPISKQRLKAIPYARSCLECKQKEEHAG